MIDPLLLATGRFSFLLSALEAFFIKAFQPHLCRQKEFAYSLKVFLYRNRL